MEIAKVSHRKPPLKKLPKPPGGLPKHEPGLLRDIVEKSAGVISAATRIPSALVSGLAVGTYHGARKGADANFQVRPESVALGVVACNALQSVARGMIGGYLLLGPAGALVTTSKEVGESGVGLYLFVKGGAAKVVGQDLAAAINTKVAPGEGGLEGAYHGALAGAAAGVKSGAKTGFQEGRAAVSGVLEGLKEIPREFSDARELQGPLWKRAISAVSGALTAAFAAPAGLALSLLKGLNGERDASVSGRYAMATATGALMGGLAGSLLGPVGVLVGAGAGALAGLLGPTSKKGFEAKLASSLTRAKSDDGDLGSEVGNNRRDLLQKVVTGLASGARQGWDAGSGTFAGG